MNSQARTGGRPGRKAFTLIELLVVIAIIAILASMLLPSLGRARGVAKDTACRTNLRSLGLAMSMYLSDFSETLPVWGNSSGDMTANYCCALAEYLSLRVDDYVAIAGGTKGRRHVFACPSVNRADQMYVGELDYAMAWRMSQKKVRDIMNPDKSILLIDANGSATVGWSTASMFPYCRFRHSREAANILFVDLHLDSKAAKELSADNFSDLGKWWW